MRFLLCFCLSVAATCSFAQSKWAFGVHGSAAQNYFSMKDHPVAKADQPINGFGFGVSALRWVGNMAIQTGVNYNIRQGGVTYHNLRAQVWRNSMIDLPSGASLYGQPNLVYNGSRLVYNFNTVEVPFSLLLASKPNLQNISFFAQVPMISVQVPMQIKGSVIQADYGRPISNIDITDEMPSIITTLGLSGGMFIRTKGKLGVRIEVYAQRAMQDFTKSGSERWLGSTSFDAAGNQVLNWYEEDTTLRAWNVGARLSLQFGSWRTHEGIK